MKKEQPQCTCDMKGAETDIGHKIDCPVLKQSLKQPTDWEKSFDEKFKCIQSDCDGTGHIQISEDESHQCQFHGEYIFPLKSFIRSLLSAQKEELMKEFEKEKWEKFCSGCGYHDSIWKTVVKSPQWERWYKFQQGENQTYDTDECQELGIIGEKHFQDFIFFLMKEKREELVKISEKLEKGESDGWNWFFKNGGNCGPGDDWASGYNQALTDIAEKVKEILR